LEQRNKAQYIHNFVKQKEFAERRRKMSQNSIEELIELLRNEDLQTRFFAEMCLRDATNT